MNKIEWSEKFSVGIKLVDQQHQRLIELINELYQHAESDNIEKEKEYFASVIDFAIHYVKIHFSTEEVMMKKTNYPDFKKHYKEHEAFTVKVVEISMNYKEDPHFHLMDFTNFLYSWIMNHIAGSDKKYFEWNEQIGYKGEDLMEIDPEKKLINRIKKIFIKIVEKILISLKK